MINIFYVIKEGEKDYEILFINKRSFKRRIKGLLETVIGGDDS